MSASFLPLVVSLLYMSHIQGGRAVKSPIPSKRSGFKSWSRERDEEARLARRRQRYVGFYFRSGFTRRDAKRAAQFANALPDAGEAHPFP
jgi:hypothetical protein